MAKEPRVKVVPVVAGEDVYTEHQTSVVLARLSCCASLVVTADSSGLVKAWRPGPPPATTATFISANPVTALCWLQDSPRYFLYGTATGQARLCDALESRAVAEVGPELLAGQQVWAV